MSKHEEKNNISSLAKYFDALLFSQEPSRLDLPELPEELEDCYERLEKLKQRMQKLHDYEQSNDDGKNNLDMKVGHLLAKEERLRRQKDKIEKSVKELRAFRDIMRFVMNQLNDAIIVIAKDSGDILFYNDALLQWKQESKEVVEEIKEKLREYKEQMGRVWEMLGLESCERNYIIETFSLTWIGREARVHIVTDITERRRQQEEMERFAYTDALTGLYNRRYCLKMMEQYKEQKIQYTVVYIDLDNLKYANDTFGHKEGDRYLLAVSGILKKTFRQGDVLCRIGGDEFVILLVQCSQVKAIGRLKEIDRELERQSKFRGYPMSISYGMIEVDKEVGYQPKAILDMADQEMYQRKLKR